MSSTRMGGNNYYALQLEAAQRRSAVILRFNYEAHSKFEVLSCSTLRYAVTLTSIQ